MGPRPTALTAPVRSDKDTAKAGDAQLSYRTVGPAMCRAYSGARQTPMMVQLAMPNAQAVFCRALLRPTRW